MFYGASFACPKGWNEDDIKCAKEFEEGDFLKGKFVRIKAGKEKLEHDEGTGCYKCPEPYRDGRAPRVVAPFHRALRAPVAEEGSDPWFEDFVGVGVGAAVGGAESSTERVPLAGLTPLFPSQIPDSDVPPARAEVEAVGAPARKEKPGFQSGSSGGGQIKLTWLQKEDKGGVSSSENKEGGVAKAVSL